MITYSFPAFFAPPSKICFPCPAVQRCPSLGALGTCFRCHTRFHFVLLLFLLSLF
jgi:hypothetical protein